LRLIAQELDDVLTSRRRRRAADASPLHLAVLEALDQVVPQLRLGHYEEARHLLGEADECVRQLLELLPPSTSARNRARAGESTT